MVHLNPETSPEYVRINSEIKALEKRRLGDEVSPGVTVDDRLGKLYSDLGAIKNNSFVGGHWSEPNVLAHMRTSMVKDAQGRNVFHLDELQSDWGQKLRDGGVRDEAKIAELNDVARRLERQQQTAFNTFPRDFNNNIFGAFADKYENLVNDATLARSEARTAEANVTGHPLVNTTDQWVNTSLRRALRQAAEADADAFAIPSGNTIQKYGMGADEAGNAYAYDKMYPSKLEAIIKKFDKGASRQYVDKMMDQSGAAIPRSAGHTVFPLSPEVRKRILEEGLPLFANGSSAGSIPAVAPSDRDAIARILERLNIH